MADTEKQIRTVEYVNPNLRDWTGDDGKKMWFAECAFENGEAGSIVAFAKDKADAAQEALRQIKDQPVEFELKRGKVFNNVQNWSIKGFPGMPAMGGGGGGGSRGGGGMSHAQAGLMAAASALGPSFAAYKDQPVTLTQMAEDIAELGDALTEHLFARRGGQAAEGEQGTPSNGQAGTEQPAEPAPATPAAEKLRLPQMVKIRELATAKGHDPDNLAEVPEVGKLIGDLTPEEADALIGAWS